MFPLNLWSNPDTQKLPAYLEYLCMEENSRNTCSSFKVAYEKKTKVDALLRKGSKAAERVRNSGFNAYFHWHLEVQYSILICRCLYLETYHFIWQQAYDKRSVWQEREEKGEFHHSSPSSSKQCYTYDPK